jgi:hypothetical protein
VQSGTFSFGVARAEIPKGGMSCDVSENELKPFLSVGISEVNLFSFLWFALGRLIRLLRLDEDNPRKG